MQIDERDTTSPTESARSSSWRDALVFSSVCGLVYLGAVFASAVMLIGVDSRVAKLAAGAAELVFKNRGKQLNPSARYPSAECFITDCRPSGDGAEFSYQVTIKFSGAKLFNARPGAIVCNELILEPLWRVGCGEIWVEKRNLSENETQLALDFLQRPCRYLNQTHQDIEKAFQCRDGKATTRPKVMLTIDPGDGEFPSRLQHKVLDIE